MTELLRQSKWIDLIQRPRKKSNEIRSVIFTARIIWTGTWIIILNWWSKRASCANTTIKPAVIYSNSNISRAKKSMNSAALQATRNKIWHCLRLEFYQLYESKSKLTIRKITLYMFHLRTTNQRSNYASLFDSPFFDGLYEITELWKWGASAPNP